MARVIIPLADQRRRRAELDAIRTRRKLTLAEAAEDDMLSYRAYMREWRASLREREARLT